ncbi:MAG: hypothetical protein WCP30_01805 [Mycobacteriaceae bacterium]
MNRTRQFLALLASGIGIFAALLGAPTAVADENGGGGPNNPLLPGCEAGTDGGGEDTVCASPGNSELSFSPNSLGIEGAMVGQGGGGFGGF